jgi:hypothetical protein
MSGSIYDIDLRIIPVAGGRSACDGNSPVLLLLHPVHGGLTVIDFADAVAFSGIVENPFGGRGLSGINMGHDAYISCVVL